MCDRGSREFDSDDSSIYEVEFVYGKKMFKKKTFYAVKWLGWDKSQMSWEPSSNFTTISSYLLRRIETRLCYAQYYKQIAPSSKGIRVHVKGKFCQVQQVDTNLKQKAIELEKKTVSHYSDTSDLYDKAEKIITQMKQNLLCSSNDKNILKSQKKVQKSNNHINKILNQQEKYEVISINSLSQQKQGKKKIPHSKNQKKQFNQKKRIDLELERDIQLLIQNEKKEKSNKQSESQVQIFQQNLSQKNDQKSSQDTQVIQQCKQQTIQIQEKKQQQNQQEKSLQKQRQQKSLLSIQESSREKNYNQHSQECQIILNEPDNSGSINPFSIDIKSQNKPEMFIRSSMKNNKVLKNASEFDLRTLQSKLKNSESLNVQETISQPCEESFEIDLILVEFDEQQQKYTEELKVIEKAQKSCLQDSSITFSNRKDSFSNMRVVKSAFNPKNIKNLISENSEIQYKTEKQFIFEIIEEQKRKQVDQYSNFTLKQLLLKQPKMIQSIKTSQQIQEEIQKLQLEKMALNKTSRCSVPIIPKFKDIEVQYFENNVMNFEMVQYDMDLNEVKQKKINIEIIESHHLLIGKLLFKCLYDNGMEYYVEFENLQRQCPTLLLDYMIVNSILI